MENNNTSQTAMATPQQFVLSYELLSLLQWMMDHEMPKLKKIITSALRSGLQHEIQHPEFKSRNMHTFESAQSNVIEFFGLLEALMVEIIHEQAVENVLEKNLMPALSQLDTQACSASTVRTSLEKATQELEINPHQNPQEVLLKVLLKQWKPNKQQSPH